MLVCGSCSLTFCFVSIRQRYQLNPSLTYACGPIHTLLHFQAWQLGQSVPQIPGSEPNDVPSSRRLLSPRLPVLAVPASPVHQIDSPNARSWTSRARGSRERYLLSSGHTLVSIRESPRSHADCCNCSGTACPKPHAACRMISRL